MNGDLFIKNASQIITVSGVAAKRGKEMGDIGVIEGGAVLVQNGKITAVGKSPELEARVDGATETIDAAGRIVLPGFVDSHTHLVFAGFRADEFLLRTQGASYMDIMKRGGGIQRTVNDTRNASKESLERSALNWLDHMLEFGVTTVEAKSGYGLDRDTEIKQLEVMQSIDRRHPVDVAATFLGAHAVPPDYKGKTAAYLEFLRQSVMPEIREKGLAEFCDIFCEKGVFSIEQSRIFLGSARKMGFYLKIHADEIFPLGGAELAASLGALSADHLLMASDQGISNLARKGVIATLLPGTAFCLKEPYARARHMIDRGCAVALATDFNPGSCATFSIPFIMAVAVMQMGMTIEEAITAFTLNGAAALMRSHLIGSIEPGKWGDMVVIDYPSYGFIPYHAGMNPVQLTIKKGNIVWRREKGTCYPVSP